jgi:hypothetical protein
MQNFVGRRLGRASPSAKIGTLELDPDPDRRAVRGSGHVDAGCADSQSRDGPPDEPAPLVRGRLDSGMAAAKLIVRGLHTVER